MIVYHNCLQDELQDGDVLLMQGAGNIGAISSETWQRPELREAK